MRVSSGMLAKSRHFINPTDSTVEPHQAPAGRRRHHVGMLIDRPNTDLAAAVDVALLLAEQQGVRAAAAFLASRGAGIALICRVLQEPARRRSAATTPVPATRPPRARAPSA